MLQNFMIFILPFYLLLQTFDFVQFAEKFGLPVAVLIPVVLYLKGQSEKKDTKLFDLLIEQNNYLRSLVAESGDKSNKQNFLLSEISENIKDLQNFKCVNYETKK